MNASVVLPPARRSARARCSFLASVCFVFSLIATLATVSFGQSYVWKNVVTGGGGGFIPGIIFNPTEKNLIYARTDIGGAYRWNQSTQSWVPLLDWLSGADWNLTGVSTLATDPVDPTRVYVAAGTYTNSWTSQNGAILRSSDRGNTWARTDLPFKLGGNMPGRSMGERLAVDPNKNSILYLGTPSGNGLWRSTDFGVTWSKVTNFPDPGTYVQKPGDSYQGDLTGVVWVTFDKRSATAGNTTQIIYVGVADTTTSIYRSIDGGTTWSAVPGQPSGFLPHHGILGSNGLLYISYSDTQGPYDGAKGDVWKFNTATGVWSLISPIPSSSSDDYFGYGGLAVDAQNPNTVMVASLNSWWPDVMIYRSRDAGATWTRIWDWSSYPNRTFRYTQDISAAPWLTLGIAAQPPVTSPKLGWMVDALAIDPFDSNRMMYGTGATLYGTTNLTQWDAGGQIAIKVMAAGIEETAVLDLISPPSGAPLLSAVADVGGFRHTDLTTPPAAVYSAPNFTTSRSLDFAELNPNFVVRTGDSSTTYIAFSYDNGVSWFAGSTQPGGVTAGGDVAASANASSVVWSPTGAGVSYSTNNGSSWIASTGVPAGATVASDRVNPTKYYAFSGGTFYLSTNGGATFTASAATGLPSYAQIKAVAGHEGDIWLAGGSTTTVYGIWHSTDSGAHFAKLANVEEADNIGFGKAASGQTYPALFSNAKVGGVRGIFRSDDVGATWIRINDDLHRYGNTGGPITGDPRVFGRVYFGTNGRGIIVGEPSGSVTPDFSLAASPTSLTVNRGASGTTTLTLTRTGGFTGTVALTASGLPSGVTASFNPASVTGTSSTVTFSASSTATTGPATITLTGTSGSLTHSTTVALTVSTPATPDYSLSASPASVTAAAGGTATSTVTVTPTNGFTGSVALSATGLPTGVTAAFSPASTTGTSTLTFTAASTAAAGNATVTITGTSGSLSHTTTVSLTITRPDFSLSANPASVSVVRGATATSTITVTPTGGFTGSVALSASGLPSGVTATFSPTSTTGTSTLTFTASSTATTGMSSVIVTGTSGSVSRTTTISLTVGTSGGGTGGVTVSTSLVSNSAWFNDQRITLNNTATLTALSVTITIQRTQGVSFNGQYNNIGGQIVQANSSTTSAITYTFTLASGQTLGAGTGRSFDAQTNGNGTVHVVTGDTYTVTYTTGGVAYTQSGHF